MNVGLPGTGIGGLFYMISVLVMFGYEVVQTTRGRSSGARWRTVGAEMGILAGIFAAIFAEIGRASCRERVYRLV
jgi:hypothetical protein